MAKAISESAAIDKIKSHLRSGNKGAFSSIKFWIYENLPKMSVGAWQELSGMLKEAYDLTDTELAKEFASIRHEEEVDDFTPLIKDIGLRGFLKDGMDFTSNLEAPNAFGFWSFMTVLGAALKRNTYVDMGYFKIWPSTQTILIGPSQKVTKSTIAGYIVGLATESGEVTRLMEEGSQEGLKKELQQLSEKEGQACGLIYVSEMSTMFGEKDYNRDIVKNLTDLFDNASYKKRMTMAHGVQEIKNIAISALFCSNEKWLREAVPPSAFEGGFFARLFPIWCSGTDKIVPIPKLADPHARTALQNWLKRTAFIEGPSVLTTDAIDYYTKRYTQLKETWPDDERLHPFWNKYRVHILKLGMLISISENVGQRNNIKVTDNHLYQADRLLGWVVERLPKLYGVLGTSEFGEDAMFVMNYIKSKGGRVSMQKLGKAMVRRMDSNRLRKIISDFKDYGMVVQQRSKGINGGWDVVLLASDWED